MINAADLPAVRARAVDAAAVHQDADSDAVGGIADAEVAQAPGYPSKKLVLENGRYVVADPAK